MAKLAEITSFFKIDANEDDFYFKEAAIENPIEKIKTLRHRKEISGSTVQSDKFSLSQLHKDVVSTRIFNRDGTINLLKRKMSLSRILYILKDPFHSMVNSPWRRIIVYVWMYYVVVWWIFGFIYWMCPGTCLGQNAGETAITNAFLFSVETQTTIGFGNIYPQDTYTYIVFVMQCLVGVVMDSCLLGVVYAKFSNPSNRSLSILFSNKAVVTTRDGLPYFMFRLANMRNRPLMSAEVKAFYVADAVNSEGKNYLKFTEMKVNNTQLVFFSGFPFYCHAQD